MARTMVRRARTTQRRSRDWMRQTASFTNTGSNQADAQSLSSEYRAQGGDIHGATVMAIRLSYHLSITNPSARVGGNAALYIGIIVGDYEGLASVPSPLTGSTADPRHARWMHFEKIYVPTISAAASSAQNWTTTARLEPPYREVGARRKLDEISTDIFLSMETNTADPADVFNFDFYTSTLLLLP